MNGSSRGLTLVELAVSLAISGLILAAVAGALYQFQRTPDRQNQRVVLNQELREATTWIRRDANKAQSFQALTSTTYGTFRWLDYSTFPPTRHEVDYFWEEGNELNPSATESPFNYGVLYRQVTEEGVAELRMPLARHVLTTTDISFTVTDADHELNSFSTKRVLSVTATSTFGGGIAGGLQETTTLDVEFRPEQTDALEYIYYFLHNNPTPPTGNTSSQIDLPFDLTQPTSTTLFNYDTNRDSEDGLLLIRSGKPTETDTTKFQDWVTDALTSSLTIDGRMSLFLAAAAAGFATDKAISVLATVQDIDTASSTETIIGERAEAAFNSESSWTLITMHFNNVVYTIASGHKLSPNPPMEGVRTAEGGG